MITAWSFSRWKTYDSCPFLAKCKFVDKRPEPQNPAAARGDEIHKNLEKYVKGQIRTIHPDVGKSFSSEVVTLRKKKASAELELAYTREWMPVTWFDKSVWCRVKVDAMLSSGNAARIIDYKSGKIREEHQLQLSLYAVAGLASNVKCDSVDTEIWYIDADETVTETYTRDQLPKLKREWEIRVKPMMSDKRFKPTPGNHCRWCHFRKENGGPCKY